jgi:hypothetical protein
MFSNLFSSISASSAAREFMVFSCCGPQGGHCCCGKARSKRRRIQPLPGLWLSIGSASQPYYRPHDLEIRTDAAKEADMNTQANNRHGLLAVALLALPFVTAAQTPVDEDGNAVSSYMAAPDAMDVVRETGGEDIPLLQAAELEELVGPIALYPDDLLAIVLPASAYPMQIIDAQRFLEDLEDDPTLEPNPDWDDSVVALLNYPEVLALLNEDLDWTWRLGEAVARSTTTTRAPTRSITTRTRRPIISTGGSSGE